MMKLMVLGLLMLLAACTVPPPSDSAVMFKQPEVIVDMTNDTVVNESVPIVVETQPYEPSVQEVDTTQLQALARGFAEAWTFYRTDKMYPYLHNGLKGRIDAAAFADLMLYFQPKDRAYAQFQRIDEVGGDYVALVDYGNDFTGWTSYALPLIQEDGEWHIQWFDNLSTRDGLVAACSAKLVKGPEENAKLTAAKELSASSCMEAAALALHDASICPYATHDRDRCYINLGVTLSLDQKILMCTDTTAIQDNVTIANCLYDLARSIDNVEVCRSIPTNRAERYFCIGELAARIGEPAQCNDAMNDFTMKLCFQKYADETGSVADICDNPSWRRFVNC